MRHRGIALALIVLLAGPASSQANTYTVVINNTVSWSQAQAAAALAGGYLATITSSAEQATVNALIAAAGPVQNGGFWINLRETSECCYVWDNGESSCYANFYDGEPNNGTPGETRGQIMWNLALATRRGVWNDVPEAGLPGTNDISRGGYVIEFGPPDPAGGPCGACIRVSPTSFCNNPPTGSTTTTTKVAGVSTGTGVISRTIIDAEPPPEPARLKPSNVLATYTVNVPVTSSGVPASAVAAAFIDSINRAVGSAGFVANYVDLSDNTVFRMYRAVGAYTSSDANNVPGITLNPYVPPTQTGTGPMTSWPAQGVLALLLWGLAVRARRRSGPSNP